MSKWAFLSIASVYASSSSFQSRDVLGYHHFRKHPKNIYYMHDNPGKCNTIQNDHPWTPGICIDSSPLTYVQCPLKLVEARYIAWCITSLVLFNPFVSGVLTNSRIQKRTLFRKSSISETDAFFITDLFTYPPTDFPWNTLRTRCKLLSFCRSFNFSNTRQQNGDALSAAAHLKFLSVGHSGASNL